MQAPSGEMDPDRFALLSPEAQARMSALARGEWNLEEEVQRRDQEAKVARGGRS